MSAGGVSRDGENCTSQEPEKKKVRFYMEVDICMLKEVVDANPYADCRAWKTIAELLASEFRQEFSTRNVRERVELLLKDFSKKERVILKKSGTEEQYSIRDLLLEDVKALRSEFKGASSRKKQETSAANGLRDAAALCTMNEQTEDLEAPQIVDEPDEEIIDPADVPVVISRVDISPGSSSLEPLHETSPPTAPQTAHFSPAIRDTRTAQRDNLNNVHIFPSASSSRQPEMEPSAPAQPTAPYLENSGTNKKGNLKRSVTEFMKKKQESEHEQKVLLIELRKQEIENERRKIAIEERRVAVLERNQELQERTQLKTLELLQALIDKIQ